MMANKKQNIRINILLASKSPQVVQALGRFSHPYQIAGEAVTTDGVYQRLKGVHLVVLDDVVATSALSEEGLLAILAQAEIPYTGAAGLLADPATWEARALEAAGAIEYLPPRCLVVTGWGGGVGKTTLSLDTAVRFAAQSRLPVAVVEIAYVSAFQPLCGNYPPLGDCITGTAQPGRWRGVTILPFDYDMVRRISTDRVREYLIRLKQDHVLLVVDAHYPHPLFEQAATVATHYLLVGEPARPDTVVYLDGLRGELASEGWIAFNKCRPADRLTTLGLNHDLAIPLLEGADRLAGGDLGRRVLKLLYPNWPNWRSNVTTQGLAARFANLGRR
jgi:hypothetical protein